MAAPIGSAAWGAQPFHLSGSFVNPAGASTGANHGIFHNFISDIVSTAKGIVPGLVQAVEHPIRAVDTAYNYEKAFYAPLVEGHFGKFWANVDSHPLTPLLDALTLATGVGSAIGGVAKVGEAAGILERGAADFARPGVIGKTAIEHPTSVPGVTQIQHLSTNVVRRKLVQEPMMNATTNIAATLAKLSPDGVLGTLFKPGTTGHLGHTIAAAEGTDLVRYSKDAAARGAKVEDPYHPAGTLIPGEAGVKGGSLDMSAVGRGNRLLNRTASAHKAGTRGFQIRQVGQIHHLLKKGATPGDVASLIHNGIMKGVMDHSLQIDASTAPHLASQDWEYVQHTHLSDLPHDTTFKGWAKYLEDRKNVPIVTTKDPRMAAVDENGMLTVVHKGTMKAAQTEASNSLHVLSDLATRPGKLWKYMVLANAPRYFVNNLIGNSVMLMAATRPDRLVRGIYQAISDVHGTNAATKALVDGGSQLAAAEHRLAGTWYHRWYGGTQIGPFAELQQVGQKFQKYGTKGLYTATEKVAYRGTHMVGVNAAISELPQFQDLYRQLKQQGVGRTKAFAQAADTISADPAVRSFVEKKAADWSGQYFHNSPVENMVRHLVPFYSWDRHALRFAKEQTLGRPGVTNIMAQLGNQGDTYLKKSLGNDVPDFLKGAVPLPDKMGAVLTTLLGGQIAGRKKVLLSGGWNPLSAAAEDVNAGLSLAGLQEGTAGSAAASQLSPLITGALEAFTGTSLLSGAKVKSTGGPLGTAAVQAFGGLPLITQGAAVARALGIPLGAGTRSNVTSQGKPTLYNHSEAQMIRQILGIPVRDVSNQALTIYEKKSHPSGRKRTVNAVPRG